MYIFLTIESTKFANPRIKTTIILLSCIAYVIEIIDKSTGIQFLLLLCRRLISSQLSAVSFNYSMSILKFIWENFPDWGKFKF